MADGFRELSEKLINQQSQMNLHLRELVSYKRAELEQRREASERLESVLVEFSEDFNRLANALEAYQFGVVKQWSMASGSWKRGSEAEEQDELKSVSPGPGVALAGTLGREDGAKRVEEEESESETGEKEIVVLE